MESVKLTIGEQRVRTKFNPTNDSTIAIIKDKVAELINMVQKVKDEKLEEMKNNTGEKTVDAHFALGEQIRLVSLAQTAFEEGAMWAVKAVTI